MIDGSPEATPAASISSARRIASSIKVSTICASGNGKGQIFVKGEVIKTVPEAQIVETLIEEAMRLADEMEAAGVASGEPSITVK